MSLGTKISNIIDLFDATPTGYNLSDLKTIFQIGAFEGVFSTVKKVNGNIYPAIEDQYEAIYGKNFTYEGEVHDFLFNSDYTNSNFKILLNTVSNCAQNLPDYITVDDRTYSKESFIQNFGNKLIFDIHNFYSQIEDKNLNVVCRVDNGVVSNANPIELVYSYHGDYGIAPLSMGTKAGSYWQAERMKFNGMSVLMSYGGTSMIDLYMGYLNLYLEKTSQNYINYGDSTYCPRIYLQGVSSSFYSYLFDKDILDDLIEDLTASGVHISYYDSSLNPVSYSPRLSSLTVDNARITPDFDSDFAGPYTIETTRNSLTFHWTANSDTEKVLFDLVEQTENSKTIYFSETNEVALTAVHDSNNYFDYEIAIILNNPEQGDDDTGGTGDNTSDQIRNETDASGLASTITNTYIMNLKEVMECQSKLWDTDFIQMLSQLATPSQSAIINLMLFPFDLNDYDEHDALISSDVSSITLGNFAYNIQASGAAAKILSPLNKNIELHFKLNTPILPFFGTFLDSEPYTKCMLYLPYIGYQEIDADFVYNRKLDITYIIDISSGQAKVQIWTQKGNETKFLLNEFSSQIGLQISLSSSNWNQMKLGMAIKGLEIGAAGIATQGASLMSGLSDLVGTGVTQMTQRQITAGQNQDTTDRSSPQDCFLLFIRQQPQVPDNYDSRFGRPSLKKAKVSDCHGFTTIINPIIETSATATEKEELISILSNGFIVK